MMRKVRMKSGGTITVYPDQCPIPELLEDPAFHESEFQHAMSISSGYNTDPDAQKSFWEGVLEKKKTSRHYSVFDDFPNEAIKTEAYRLAMHYAPLCKKALRGKTE
jgi:hypothetical protein